MVKLGTLNSRMKDFHDIWLLSQQFDFEGPTLAQAVNATFVNRRTAVKVDPVALTTEFSESEVANTQWGAFVRKGRLECSRQPRRDCQRHCTLPPPVAERTWPVGTSR